MLCYCLNHYLLIVLAFQIQVSPRKVKKNTPGNLITSGYNLEQCFCLFVQIFKSRKRIGRSGLSHVLLAVFKQGPCRHFSLNVPGAALTLECSSSAVQSSLFPIPLGKTPCALEGPAQKPPRSHIQMYDGFIFWKGLSYMIS